MTRYDSLVERLRQAAQPDREAPPELARISTRCGETPTRSRTRTSQALKDAGYSEDVIFEQTVSVAVAAGLERLEAGLRGAPVRLHCLEDGHDPPGGSVLDADPELSEGWSHPTS